MLLRLLADAVVLVHLAYIAFVVAGALLVLRWHRVAWAHLAAVAWGAYVEFSGTICPLTPLEQSLRLRAGQAGYRGGFIEHYLIPLMYPAALTPSLQISLGTFVLLLNLVLYAVVLRARRQTGAARRFGETLPPRPPPRRYSRAPIRPMTTNPEAHLRDLIQTVDGILYEARADTLDFTYVTRQAEAILGYPVARWMEPGFWVSRLHPDDLGPARVARETDVAQRRPHRLEYRMLAADGHAVWIHDRASVSNGAGGPLLRGLMVDISERREVEVALQGAVGGTSGQVGEAFFRSLVLTLTRTLGVRFALVGELTRPGDQRVHTVAACADGRILEGLEYDLVGSPCLPVLTGGVCFHPRQVQALFPADRLLREMEAESCLATPMVGADGIPLGFLLVLDRKPLEQTERVEALFAVFAARAGAELARRRMDAERQRLHVQLLQAQKMEAIGTLAGGIAHDFNNILMGIMGNAEMGQQSLEPAHPSYGHLGAILQASRRASDLVQRILTFSRKREPQRRPVELQDIVQDALVLARTTLPATVEVHTALPPESPPILADPGQLRQVILNLISNAADAMAPEGGTLELTQTTLRVDAAMRATHMDLREGLYVRLSVRDSGAGMDQETLTRVFDPFFTTKDPGEGTGLGLAVVHGIVQEHEGAILVSSSPGRGSLFHLFFPAMSRPQPDLPPPPDGSELARGHGEHVLFLDDEPAIVHAARRILERLGYRVSTFTSPQEALAAFRERPAEFDLLVSDFTMPGLSGTEMAREVRRLRPDLPVVLSTGYTGAPALEGAGLEIDELLAKPFSLETLAQVLARVLRSRDQGPGTGDQGEAS